jgi:hypothetical protein
MNLLDPIVVRNNKGCHLLGTGQLDDAMGQFKEALLCLRSTMLHHDDSNHCDAHRDDDATSLPSLRRLNLQDFQQLLSTHKQSCRKESSNTGMLPSHHDHFVTFSWAIPILPGFTFSSKAQDNEKVYAAILIFNLALTLHLKAIECSPCSLHGLQKVKSLYLLAQSLIVPIMFAFLQHGQPSDNAAFDLLLMGLLNNAALVHLELLEYIDCQAVFSRLIEYSRISCFRSLIGRSPPQTNASGAGHALLRTMNEVWQQEPPSYGPLAMVNYSDGGDEDCLITQVVNDILLNAIYAALNNMNVPAAAA